MPFLGQGPSYTPLDDTEEFSSDVPLQDADDHSSERSEDRHTAWPCANFSRLVQVWYKIPRPGKTVAEVSVCIGCLLAVLSVCLSLGYFTLFVHKPAPIIDKSYRAFRIPDHEASLNYGALQNAKRNHTSFSQVNPKVLGWLFKHGGQGRRRRSVSNLLSRQKRHQFIIQETQYYPEWKMQVVFLAKDGKNIFTKDKLQTIHDVELNIMKHEKFPEFCFKDIHPSIYNDPAVKVYNGCAPLNSLLTYFFPSKDEQGNIYYDGLGENIDNLESALKLAMTSNHFYYYVDQNVNSTNLKSQLLRTEVLFGAPLKGFGGPYSNRQEQTKKFKDFVVTYINLLSKSSTRDVTVLYGGKEIFDYEVEQTFWSDVQLAVYALLAIFLLMLVLTSGSVWLTVWGIISILLSAPLAIFFYRIVFNRTGLGILNGAAAFVIIGIGVDDVFVFINVFRQAAYIKDPRAKTLFTCKTAGVATFFTSFTTAAAFAANIASMIPAVHDFGLFMSLIVANCWITVVMVMPPALYIWERSFKRLEARIGKALCFCKFSGCSGRFTLPEDVAHFMDVGYRSLTNVTLTREVTDEDDDVPMLSLDSPAYFVDDEEDDDMVLVDPDPLVIPEDTESQESSQASLGSCLQGFMYHFMALPFIRARWVILGVSIALFCASLGLMTQLHTSTKPPQFFRSTTNMQQLLDLKAKFSAIDTVTCNDCSAIYSIGQRTLPTIPATHPVIPITRATTARPHREPTKTTTTSTTKVTKTRIKPKLAPTTYVPWKGWPHQAVTSAPASHKEIPTYHTQAPSLTERPHPKSVPEDYDVCRDRDCSHPQERPLLESGATVYVVLGVKHFQWTDAELSHVMSEDMGELTFDEQFSSLYNFSNSQGQLLAALKDLCILCKKIAGNSQLVRNGSAQCLPTNAIPTALKKYLFDSIPACQDLPQVSYIYGNQQPAHALGGLTQDGTAILWLGFAFESTTSKGQSYFEAYSEYQKWEKYLASLKADLDPHSPLQNMFQTSEFWPEVLMEVVAVNSAIYGVALSLVICMVAVTIFTRHVLLLLVIMISIIEMVSLVVAMFYVLGWENGGVEAISLSILVGSSVDYCVHLVEGYILAAHACPIKDNASKARHWRTSAAFSHIGVSIISSALTTIVAAIPLTQTTIQPFAKFGQIIAINTTVCIVYSLTVCTALLSTLAPAFFKPTFKSLLKIVAGTVAVVGSIVLVMFIMSKAGVDIPGPNGGALFSS